MSDIQFGPRFEMKRYGMAEDEIDDTLAVMELISKNPNLSANLDIPELGVLGLLLRGQNLTPLTNDPSEWETLLEPDVTKGLSGLWQSLRNPDIYSTTGGNSCYSLSDLSESRYVRATEEVQPRFA